MQQQQPVKDAGYTILVARPPATPLHYATMHRWIIAVAVMALAVSSGGWPWRGLAGSTAARRRHTDGLPEGGAGR